MEELQISSHRMTVFVKTENGIVVDSAPIVRKFVGQPVDNLTRWMMRQGGLVIYRLGGKECSASEI